MRLSLHTDYALRVLMFLATEQRQASVEEIAVAYGISRNHLVKVARRLAELELVEAKRGRGGGISLARPADSINVGQVVRDFETLSAFVECFDRAQNTCPVAGVCGLQGALGQAVADFLARLDQYQLSMLIPRPLDFAKRLNAADPQKGSGPLPLAD